MTSRHKDTLARMVAALPEMYQPVFGHPEYDERAARRSDDRIEAILAVIRSIAPDGRKVRILDVGSNMGYVSLMLAAQGHDVTGIDREPANVALSTLLAGEAQLPARFEHASLDEAWLARRDDGEFDLAIALSVLHHTCHEFGIVRTQRLAHRLMQRCGIVLAELAVREEPLYWGPSLPERPEAIFDQASFVRELARFPTHLSGIERPLVFASDRVTLVAGRAFAIERHTDRPHEREGGSHLGSRRYFFCRGDWLVKSMRARGPRGDYNRAEWANELRIVERHGTLPFVPSEILSEDAGSTLLSARRMHRGTLLLTLIERRIPYEPLALLRDVLRQLARLEAEGLYHRDLRTWNVLVTQDGRAQLIDFGQIAHGDTSDLVGTLTVFDAFWSLVHETVNAVAAEKPYPLLRRDPDALPEPFRSFMVRALDTTRPASFAVIEAELERSLRSRPATAAAAERIRGAAAADYERFGAALLKHLQ